MLEQFDPYSIPDNTMIIVIGKPKTGRSAIIADILSSKQHVPVGCTMKDNVYDPAELQGLYMHQASEAKASRRDKFAVVDNCTLSEQDFEHRSMLNMLLMCGRCSRISTIITVEHPQILHPGVRQNADYVFLTRETDEAVLNYLFDHFFTFMDCFSLFKSMMQRATRKGGALVIDHTVQTYNPAVSVFKSAFLTL